MIFIMASIVNGSYRLAAIGGDYMHYSDTVRCGYNNVSFMKKILTKGTP